jgi:hypothetical protein
MLPLSVAAQTPIMPISLVTPDGRIGCVQGMTGIGRPQDWRTVRDDGGPAGWALYEAAGDATDLHFPLCILPGGVLRDLEATLHFRILGGTREQAAGLMVRAQDATNYYVVRASALEKNVKIYRMQNGRRAQLAMKEAPVVLDKWQKLTVRLQGDKFEVSIDGTKVMDASDRGLSFPGALGVWIQSDSRTHFGLIELRPLP